MGPRPKADRPWPGANGGTRESSRRSLRTAVRSLPLRRGRIRDDEFVEMLHRHRAPRRPRQDARRPGRRPPRSRSTNGEGRNPRALGALPARHLRPGRRIARRRYHDGDTPRRDGRPGEARPMARPGLPHDPVLQLRPPVDDERGPRLVFERRRIRRRTRSRLPEGAAGAARRTGRTLSPRRSERAGSHRAGLVGGDGRHPAGAARSGGRGTRRRPYGSDLGRTGL